MDNLWNTPIDKLMIWHTNNWTKYNSMFGIRLTLRIHYDQLLIASDTKVLESFNMNSRIKGIYKEDILILIVSVTGQEIRKLKFQLKENSIQCLRKLGEHFPVMNYNSLQSKTAPQKYRNINEILKHALENKESANPASLPLDYGNFIKLCLLDPTFPQIVLETNQILQEEIFKK